ncbi:MAG: hypothetical protein LBR92_03725 [Puniceicoccales bacterium]|jgi:hypothetical protein|nr:hypothetical protein [Puniceicoccales bacterium]
MGKLVKKLLSVVFGINGYLFLNCLEARDSFETTLAPDEEQVAIQEMADTVKSMATPLTDKAMNELLGANVRADSKEPKKFLSNVQLELVKMKCDRNRLVGTMKKWGKVEIILRANTSDKNVNWTDKCNVKLYIGYNGCRLDGKMLLFKADCTCITLQTNKEQSILFFIPGDVYQRHNLGDVPAYCALVFTVDGIRQQTIIVNKEGKDTHRSDADTYHKTVKEQAYIDDRIVRNVDQLPIYADIRGTQHPTLLLDVDA